MVKERIVMNEIMVSIICNAYNQESYIADAIESFLMQKTEFAFEILIHDDASTDRTADIIREYEKKYPTLVKPIYQMENQYSKGGIGKFQYPRVKGKYVAICEGDDYWTDSHKLQKQVEQLEKHPECDMCAHTAIAVDAETKKVLRKISPSSEDRILTTEEVILGGGGYVATNTLMYRARLLADTRQFRKFLNLDYSLQIQGALRGGIFFIHDCMAAYRVCAKNSWTSQMKNNSEKICAHTEKVNEMLRILDRETNYKYAACIRQHILENEVSILKCKGEEKKLFSSQYKEHLKVLEKNEIIKIWIKSYFPCIFNVLKRIKCGKIS